MKKAVVAALAAFAVASGALTIQASAADLGYMPAPAPYAPIWQGFYIGGHLGFGEAEFDGSARLDGGAPFRDSLTPDGILGGAQAGYNWQWDSLIFGIEGDISFADWGKSRTYFDGDLAPFGGEGHGLLVASAEVDMLASVRGRLGMAFDHWMVYGTGGVAWADAQVRGRAEHDGHTVLSGKKSFDNMGYVAGGGLAWMMIPQTFSVGLEGLYYFFDQSKTVVDEAFEYDEGQFVDVRATARLDDAWVVRLRGDFHF